MLKEKIKSDISPAAKRKDRNMTDNAPLHKDLGRDTKYEPDALPESITRKLYVRYSISGYNTGAFNIWDTDYEQGGTVAICEAEVTIALPKIDRDGLKCKALEMLEAEKAKVLAENHQRLKSVQDKIDNLLAIEYQPAEQQP